MLLVGLGAEPVATAIVAVPVQNPEPPPGRGAEFGKSSPIALVVIVLLALATAVLVRSMSKRIKRLPASFEPAPGEGDQAPAAERDEGPRP